MNIKKSFGNKKYWLQNKLVISIAIFLTLFAISTIAGIAPPGDQWPD